MPFDTTNFLNSLAVNLAAELTIEYAGTPRALWILVADDKAAADPATALIPYGGMPTAWDPLPPRSVQVRTVGTSAVAAMVRAEAIYAEMLEGGRPWQRKVIDAYALGAAEADGSWKIVALELLQPPGMIGYDEKNRAVVVFNFSVEAVFVAEG